MQPGCTQCRQQFKDIYKYIHYIYVYIYNIYIMIHDDILYNNNR